MTGNSRSRPTAGMGSVRRRCRWRSCTSGSPTPSPQLETGEQWQAWLDFAHRLHRYSFNNLILIWTQRPDASAVASYQTWQALNRQVRRGEKAIRVLAPMVRRRPGRRRPRPTRPPGSMAGRRHGSRSSGSDRSRCSTSPKPTGRPPPETPRPVLLAGHAPAGLWEALGGGDRPTRLPAAARTRRPAGWRERADEAGRTGSVGPRRRGRRPGGEDPHPRARPRHLARRPRPAPATVPGSGRSRPSPSPIW